MHPTAEKLARLAQLKIGETVEVRVGAKWVKVRVEGHGLSGELYVRQPGLTRNGVAYGRMRKYPKDIRTNVGLEPLASNVYADWLDERGQHVAAAMLREAFPLASEVITASPTDMPAEVSTLPSESWPPSHGPTYRG